MSDIYYKTIAEDSDDYEPKIKHNQLPAIQQKEYKPVKLGRSLSERRPVKLDLHIDKFRSSPSNGKVTPRQLNNGQLKEIPLLKQIPVLPIPSNYPKNELVYQKPVLLPIKSTLDSPVTLTPRPILTPLPVQPYKPILNYLPQKIQPPLFANQTVPTMKPVYNIHFQSTPIYVEKNYEIIKLKKPEKSIRLIRKI